MGAVKKKRQLTPTASGKERTQTYPTKSGLTQKVKSVTAVESCPPGKYPNFPDAEMIDAEPTRSTNPVFKTTKIAEQVPEASSSKKGKVVAREESTQNAGPSARKIAVPVFKRTVASKTTSYPQELQAVVEAEKRRADIVSIHLGICSTAINSVEAAFSPLSTGENKSFVDGIKVYLRAAIAQYVHTGPGSAPPLLPPRPMNPISKVSDNGAPITTIPRAQIPTNTWATVARKGLRNAAASTPKRTAPPAKSTKILNSKTKADRRLFLRLDESNDLYKLSLAGVKEILILKLGLSEEEICLFQRVKTGYALTAKDEATRQSILETSSAAAGGIYKLEEASNLIAISIATVLVTINTSFGLKQMTAKMVTDEITRATNKIPAQVQLHGTCKEGSPYQNWMALFPRESAPRPGFRLFYDSGMATPFRSRRQVEHCKRCLGFHATHGCSRAPACWNCGSTKLSAMECKAFTKC